LRLQLNKSQLDVAEEAGISVSALQGLEGGHGSRLKTVIQVARVLGRADWLATFAPPTTVSPMEVLRARQREDEARRARARPKKTATS
jgi:transcriptional regulator with XRE-family HTH domain